MKWIMESAMLMGGLFSGVWASGQIQNDYAITVDSNWPQGQSWFDGDYSSLTQLYAWDDEVTELILPWNFVMFGQSNNVIYLSSNGFVSFDYDSSLSSTVESTSDGSSVFRVGRTFRDDTSTSRKTERLRFRL